MIPAHTTNYDCDNVGNRVRTQVRVGRNTRDRLYGARWRGSTQAYGLSRTRGTIGLGQNEALREKLGTYFRVMNNLRNNLAAVDMLGEAHPLGDPQQE